MRHRKSGKRLGRTSSHRQAMFSNMMVSLFEHERIQTTDAKAKELRRRAERLITTAKHGLVAENEANEAVDQHAKQRLVARNIHLRRHAARVIKDREVLQKLFSELADRYADRPGGYTRITKLGHRRGDAAPVSMIELVDTPYAPGASAPIADDDDDDDVDVADDAADDDADAADDDADAAADAADDGLDDDE